MSLLPRFILVSITGFVCGLVIASLLFSNPKDASWSTPSVSSVETTQPTLAPLDEPITTTTTAAAPARTTVRHRTTTTRRVPTTTTTTAATDSDPGTTTVPEDDTIGRLPDGWTVCDSEPDLCTPTTQENPND